MHRINRSTVPTVDDPESILRKARKGKNKADMADGRENAALEEHDDVQDLTAADLEAHLEAAVKRALERQAAEFAAATRSPYNESGRAIVESFETERAGYSPAIVVPPITADHFELKQTTIQSAQAQFTFLGIREEDPHEFIGGFSDFCDTIKYKGVTSEQLKLTLFPHCLKGAAKEWLRSRPPRSITSWAQCADAFLGKFCPPRRNIELMDEIHRFSQKQSETLAEAWTRFSLLTRQCPKHDYSDDKLMQFFYGGLDRASREILDAEVGGNLLIRADAKGAMKLLNELEKRDVTLQSHRRTEPMVDPASQAMMNELNKKMDALTKLVTRQQVHAVEGHDGFGIPMEGQLEDLNYVGNRWGNNGFQQNRNHPGLRYGNPNGALNGPYAPGFPTQQPPYPPRVPGQQQAQAPIQQQQQPIPHAGIEELKNMMLQVRRELGQEMGELRTQVQEQVGTLAADLQNTKVAVRNLETQVGQLALSISARIPSTRPPNSENTPKAQTNVMRLVEGTSEKKENPTAEQAECQKSVWGCEGGFTKPHELLQKGKAHEASREEETVVGNPDEEQRIYEKLKRIVNKRSEVSLSPGQVRANEEPSLQSVWREFERIHAIQTRKEPEGWQRLRREFMEMQELERRKRQYEMQASKIKFIPPPKEHFYSRRPDTWQFEKSLGKIRDSDGGRNLLNKVQFEDWDEDVRQWFPVEEGPAPEPLLPIHIGGRFRGMGLCDSGATVSTMPLQVARSIGSMDIAPTKCKMKVADGRVTECTGQVENILIRIGPFYYLVKFLIMDIPVDPDHPFILGRNFMKTAQVQLCMSRGEISLISWDKELIVDADQNMTVRTATRKIRPTNPIDPGDDQDWIELADLEDERDGSESEQDQLEHPLAPDPKLNILKLQDPGPDEKNEEEMVHDGIDQTDWWQILQGFAYIDAQVQNDSSEVQNEEKEDMAHQAKPP